MSYYINEINKAGKIAVDDTILVKDVPATAGSKMLENFKPLFSAEAVERLEKAGYDIAGKTNVGEFGLDLMGEVDMIAGRNVLIIDDICSKGGTFYHSAKRLKEAGAANIYLYVTHCESTIYEGELLKEDSLIKHIFTTNSLLTAPNEKMTIVE